MMQRRSFLILATGSLAMAALAGCSQQAVPAGDREATLEGLEPPGQLAQDHEVL